MYYFKELLNFDELYNMFLDTEAGVYLQAIKDWNLGDRYMKWLDNYFKNTAPTLTKIEWVINNKWNDFRLHIPFLTMGRFTSLMKELVNDMDFLDDTKDLHFPLVVTHEGMPKEWARFTKECYDYDLPIKFGVDSRKHLCKIFVLKDFRDMFEEREVKENA